MWPSKACALGLVLVVAFFALEMAVHSIHHLDPNNRQPCVLYGVSQQLVGVTVVGPAVEPLAALPQGWLPVDRPRLLPLPPFGLHAERAPPRSAPSV